MKIIIAPNSFKGCLKSTDISNIIEKGIKKIIPNSKIIKSPLADGGDGTLEVLKNLIGGKYVEIKATDPIGRKIKTKYIKKGNVAYIEMAKISGIALLKENEKNPLKTTTFGLGEIIIDAIQKGCKKIYIGVGGSSTNDGGIGALTAIGFKFVDKEGKIIFPGEGKDLIKIKKVIYPENYDNLKKIEFIILSDVKNPLYGKKGAAYVYAPQKGADKKMVKILDYGLRNYAKIIKKYKGININKIEGSGAAGGIVAGFFSFLNTSIVSGIEEILKLGKFEVKIKNAKILVTGEGKIDKQTLYGKAVGVILKISEKYKIHTIVLAGIVDEKIYNYFKSPYVSILSIAPGPIPVEKSIRKARKYIEIKIKELAKLFI